MKKIQQCPVCFEPYIVRELEGGMTRLFKLCNCEKEMKQ